jgi:hypothetical protein
MGSDPTIEKQALSAADALMREYGPALSGEWLQKVLALAWLMGSRQELEAALERLKA